MTARAPAPPPARAAPCPDRPVTSSSIASTSSPSARRRPDAAADCARMHPVCGRAGHLCDRLFCFRGWRDPRLGFDRSRCLGADCPTRPLNPPVEIDRARRRSDSPDAESFVDLVQLLIAVFERCLTRMTQRTGLELTPCSHLRSRLDPTTAGSNAARLGARECDIGHGRSTSTRFGRSGRANGCRPESRTSARGPDLEARSIYVASDHCDSQEYHHHHPRADNAEHDHAVAAPVTRR